MDTVDQSNGPCNVDPASDTPDIPFLDEHFKEKTRSAT